MWDYNIPPEHCLQVLEGKRELAGHYNEKTLFRKLIESFPWYTIMLVLDMKRIKSLLTEDIIQSLRFRSLSDIYEFISSRLPKTI